MKKIFQKFYYFGNLPDDKINLRQKRIRDAEWEVIKKYMHNNSLFLDVGCGIGYNLKKAMQDFNCECIGIDPEPGIRGVQSDNNNNQMNIYKGEAEKLPFENKKFDVVFSSHVLEHVTHKNEALKEMKRVLKDDGVLILGVPTATMACIRFISMSIFTTHQRIIKLLIKPFVKTGKIKFINMFVPPSHSDPGKTIINDLLEYRIVEWNKIISKELKIKNIVLPGLYLYPDYIIQLSGIKRLGKYSSSCFFICEK